MGVRERTNVQPVTEATDIVTEDVAPLQPKRQRKRKTVIADAGGSLHPPKKLREDHGTPIGPYVAGKSRFVISSDSSHHSGANVVKVEVDSLVRSDFLVSGVRTVINPDADLQKVYVPQRSVTNWSRLDDEMRVEYNIKEKRSLKSAVDEKNKLLKVREKKVEDLKAQLFLKEAKATEAIRLRAEAFKFKAIKKSLQDEVKALTERNASLEKKRVDLDVKVTGLEASAMGKDREFTDLNAQLTSAKSHNDSLVHELEVASFRLQEKLSSYENSKEQLEEFQDAQLKIVNDKIDKLFADFVEMALHLEERFYHHLLTTIFGHRWLLTHGIELAITKCLHSPEYLSALRAAIGKAIEKSMQDGLSAGITHGMKGRIMTNVDASNKDASVDTLMNILRLEETLAERLASRIAASSLCSSKMSRLIPRALLFCTKSTFDVLSVGMPISAGMTASVPYVNENMVSPLLDFIIVRCAHKT
nr:hypothetical protein [Tanacetum cinerariifolium]